jgi:hypothetical protein
MLIVASLLVSGGALAIDQSLATPGSSVEHISRTSDTPENTGVEAGIAEPKSDVVSDAIPQDAAVHIDTNANSSRVEVSIDASAQHESRGPQHSGSSLIINGQAQPLPPSGRFSQVIHSGTSHTRIRGDVDSNGTSIRITTDTSTIKEVE